MGPPGRPRRLRDAAPERGRSATQSLSPADRLVRPTPTRRRALGEQLALRRRSQPGSASAGGARSRAGTSRRVPQPPLPSMPHIARRRAAGRAVVWPRVGCTGRTQGRPRDPLSPEVRGNGRRGRRERRQNKNKTQESAEVALAGARGGMKVAFSLPPEIQQGLPLPCGAPRPGGPVSVDIELNQARLLWTVVRAARQGVSEVSRGTSRPCQWQVPAGDAPTADAAQG